MTVARPGQAPAEERPTEGGGPASPASLSRAAALRLRGGQLPHVPPAAAPVSSHVRLDLVAPTGSQPEAVIRDVRREAPWRVALQEVAVGHWSTEIQLPHRPTVLRYSFALADGSVIRERRQVIGESTPMYGEWEWRDFQVAAYDPAQVPPAWTRGSVVYQIFPDRFAAADPDRVRNGGDVYGQEPRYLRWDEPPEHPPRGRDFYGGDLAGIVERLDHIARLGVDCIYLTPIFAARTNHRYDAVDYFRIDPRLGDEADLRRLVAAAGERGIRVVLDGVFNHCSSESDYLLAARADRTSPYFRWFEFTEWPDRWTGWADVAELPELVECPETEEFFFGPQGVARHWLSTGIAGWRLDVVPWITDEWWRRFRHALRADRDDLYLVAEDWGDATHRLVGDSFDAAMNYRFGYSVAGFALGRLGPAELDDRLETIRRDTPEPAFHAQLNLLDSHDTPRLLTVCGGDRRRMMLAAALQFAYPGMPMLYYGDEAGLEGAYAEASRRAYPWHAPDEELLAFYRTVINARRSSAALSRGGVETAWIDDRSGTYGFLRRDGHETVLALFNGRDEPARIELPLPEGLARPVDLLGRAEVTVAEGRLRLELGPLGFAWLGDVPDTDEAGVS